MNRTKLMVEHGVGSQVERNQRVVEIDEDVIT